MASLSTIRFYIILKPADAVADLRGLSTIRFYIILKLHELEFYEPHSLSTIRFYIILKHNHYIS